MRDASASVYTKRIWKIFAVGLLLSLPAVVYSAVYDGLNINTPLTHEIMRQAKSAGMRSLMDDGCKPCDDYYKHACGNFARINPAQDTISTDFQRTLNTAYLRRVRQLLNVPKMSTDSPTETRVKYFYESCQKASEEQWKLRPKLIALFKEFGGFPALEGSNWDANNFDPIDMMARLLNRFGKITLLNVKVSPGLVYNQSNRLYLGQLENLPSTKAIPLHLSDQLKLQINLMNILGLNETVARRTAAEIAELNVELSEGIIEPSHRHAPGEVNRLRMLDEMTNNYGSHLNLTQFVHTWLGHDYLLPVYEYGENFMFKLNRWLIKSKKRVLANYMLSSLMSDFQMVSCEQKTTEMFPDFVDYLVYRSLTQQSPHIPGSLRQLWQDLKESFERILQSPSSSWLDESTRKEAVEKLKAMSFTILGSDNHNFEDYYGSLVISTADYFGNVERLLELRGRQLREDLQRAPSLRNYYGINRSPFYIFEFNKVVMPASYMQHRYLFDDVYPSALKYGTVGFALAHEMAHGFDDMARTFDGNGNLRDWWSGNDTRQFEERKQCLADQFSEIIYNDRKLPELPMQSENIADNVGVRIAHAAYLTWLKQQSDNNSKFHSEESEVLPRMPQSPEQLFFLALGQIWCSDFKPQWRDAISRGDEHAPNEVRLNVIMSNFDAFSTAHECPDDAHINPKEKCVIY